MSRNHADIDKFRFPLVEPPNTWKSPTANVQSRAEIAARNLAILHKIAINLIGRDRSARVSVRARRKQAAWNDDYMLSLLAG